MAGQNIPTEVLSDISNFIPDDEVQSLTFLSRAFAAVTTKRRPIINVKNRILIKTRRAQWPLVRTMIASQNYYTRYHSPNIDGEQYELSFCMGDKITILGDIDENRFYFGVLNGAHGLVPSTLLSSAVINTPIALMPPEAKAWILSFFQFELYPYMAAQNCILPTKILSDISNFVPDDDMKNLGFVSRAFAVLMRIRLPIIKARNRVFFEAQRTQCPRVRIITAKWDYDTRIHSLNVEGRQYELSFFRGDKITIFGDIYENGFYFGELNGVRGFVPSNLLYTTVHNTHNAVIPSQAKCSARARSAPASYRKTNTSSGEALNCQKNAAFILPDAILSDISNFIPDDDVKNLTFLSRAFVAVTAKRLPIINAKNKFLNKSYWHCQFWKHRSIEKHFKENPELTMKRRDQISVEHRQHIDKEFIECRWATLQVWRKKGLLEEDPYLRLLEKSQTYNEDPEGFWNLWGYGYVSPFHMDPYEYMSLFLNSDGPLLLNPGEIIKVLYREDPELTRERRDLISVNFHIDKVLIEAHWSALQRWNKHRSQPKPHPFWENDACIDFSNVEPFPKFPEHLIDPTKYPPEVRIDPIKCHLNKVKQEVFWYRAQRSCQRIIRRIFHENPELTTKRQYLICAELASIRTDTDKEFNKTLIVEYWSLLIRRYKKGKIDLWHPLP